MHVVEEQITADAQLLQLNFLRTDFARTVDGVVRRVVEIEIVVGVDSNFRRNTSAAEVPSSADCH